MTGLRKNIKVVFLQFGPPKFCYESPTKVVHIKVSICFFVSQVSQ